MDILLMMATAVACGILATLTSRRQGIGWWIGDQASAIFGAGFGAYMVNTVFMNKPLDLYLAGILMGSAMGALFMLAFSNSLLGGEEEDTPPMFTEAAAHAANFNEIHDEPEPMPFRRAA